MKTFKYPITTEDLYSLSHTESSQKNNTTGTIAEKADQLVNTVCVLILQGNCFVCFHGNWGSFRSLLLLKQRHVPAQDPPLKSLEIVGR